MELNKEQIELLKILFRSVNAEVLCGAIADRSDKDIAAMVKFINLILETK